MKRIALLFSVLIIYQVFFYSWFLHLACQVHRWKVKQSLTAEHSSLQLRLAKNATLRPGEFRHWKPGDEIVIGDVYFDVADVREEGDELVLSCVEDSFETMLLSVLSGFLDTQDDTPSPGTGIPLLSPFLLPSAAFFTERVGTVIPRFGQALLHQEMYLLTDTPPPDLS